jgi:hypothetical protein
MAKNENSTVYEPVRSKQSAPIVGPSPSPIIVNGLTKPVIVP